MGRWTYYAPFYLGALVTVIVAWNYRASLPEWMARSYGVFWPASGAAAFWPMVIALGLLVGLHLQLGLIGLQGAFAQVLPVPGGRSIRGGGAVLGGVLILAWWVLAGIALLLRLERDMQTSSWIFALAGLAALLAAAGTYAWHWPAAIRDFAEEHIGFRARVKGDTA